MPGNHVDATRDLLQQYEVNINNLKADNLRYKGLEQKVFELEKHNRQLEDEVNKAHRVKSTLEN